MNLIRINHATILKLHIYYMKLMLLSSTVRSLLSHAMNVIRTPGLVGDSEHELASDSTTSKNNDTKTSFPISVISAILNFSFVRASRFYCQSVNG